MLFLALLKYLFITPLHLQKLLHTLSNFESKSQINRFSFISSGDSEAVIIQYQEFHYSIILTFSITSYYLVLWGRVLAEETD